MYIYTHSPINDIANAGTAKDVSSTTSGSVANIAPSCAVCEVKEKGYYWQ
jgi:hypothetical protein